VERRDPPAHLLEGMLVIMRKRLELDAAHLPLTRH
jgi:hypothetical protein